MLDDTVGIVTLPGDTNYGNRLQNFALQQAILALGIARVESIEGLPTGESREVKLLRLASTAYPRRREVLDALLRRRPQVGMPDRFHTPPQRRAAIRAFSETWITAAPPPSDPHAPTFTTIAERYRRIVVGSDQVWNPAFTHANREWFLSFARPHQRVAYAASIGVPEVPRYLHHRFRKGLRQIGPLSVREERAATIVEELIGSRPPVVLDPTMLLTRQNWEAVATRPLAEQAGGYVATFMLATGDGAPASGGHVDTVRTYARKHDLRIIDLNGPTDPEVLSFGPAEFLGAIRDAALVVTDSFHAAVFCALFHRPFALVPRGAMNSRFDTLLHHTRIGGRFLSEYADLDELKPIDWEKSDKAIAEARESSMAYLASALGVGPRLRD